MQRTAEHLADACLQITTTRVKELPVRLPDGLLIRQFLDGSLKSLDEGSTMIWPEDMVENDKMMKGDFGGVGLQLGDKQEFITIDNPMADAPAFQAGLESGDVILAVDGVSTENSTTTKTAHKIMGPVGSTVVLTIRRTGWDKPKDFRLVREKIRCVTVEGAVRHRTGHWDFLLNTDRRIGYVRITNLMPQTGAELKAVLESLGKQNAQGVIIDLRFCPGGLLSSAVEISDLFISEGVIVATRGRTAAKAEEQAHPGAGKDKLPLVVLVNSYSFAGAEIVAGALQDHGRAVLVGERTPGRATIQNILPLAQRGTEPKTPSAYLRLTTDYDYLPSGRSISRTADGRDWGVEPAVRVEITPDELADVLAIRRQVAAIGGADRAAPPPASRPWRPAAKARSPSIPWARVRTLWCQDVGRIR